MCGLCTGVVIFYSVRKIDEYRRVGGKSKDNSPIWLYRIISVFLLFFPLILSGLHIVERRLSLICEFVGIVLALSSITDLNGKCNRTTDLVAKLSMIIYIVHWSIGQNISYYLPEAGINVKLVLYYSLTLFVAVFLMLFVNACKNKAGRMRM